MTEATQTLLNSVAVAIVSALLGLLSAWVLFRRANQIREADRIATGHIKLLERVADLEGKLALVNQAVIPISTAFQAILIKELTHYHTPEMDGLMTKIGPPNLLTPAEELRLAILLEERTRDMDVQISDSERDAALILPAVMKRARAEAEVLIGAEALKLKLVTVAAVVGLPVVIAETR